MRCRRNAAQARLERLLFTARPSLRSSQRRRSAQIAGRRASGMKRSSCSIPRSTHASASSGLRRAASIVATAVLRGEARLLREVRRKRGE
jgi:hypothetical protein